MSNFLELKKEVGGIAIIGKEVYPDLSKWELGGILPQQQPYTAPEPLRKPEKKNKI